MMVSASYARPQAALLINPRAGRNAADPVARAALKRSFARFGPCVETDHPTEVDALVRGWYAEGIRWIVVCGGDGTLQSLAGALVRAWPGRTLPDLSLLHGGTTGLVAHAIGAGEARVQTLDIGGRICFNLGIGLVSDVSEAYVATQTTTGPVRFAASLALSALFGGQLAQRSMGGWRGGVQLDDGPVRNGHILGLYASALDRGGLGPVRAFDQPERDARALRVLVADLTPRAAALGVVPLLLGVGVSGLAVSVARRLRLVPDGPSRFMADGEQYPFDAPLSVGAGPTLTFVPPP